MPIDLYACTNPVNYAVALASARARPGRPALLLYETRRFAVRPQPGLRQWRLSVATARLLRAWLALGGAIDTAYLPHPKVNRRVLALASHARQRAWLDDGLDTLRRKPANFDPAALVPGTRYLTFAEHASVAPWLAPLQVERVASLPEVMLGSLRPRADLSPWRHLFVESPGLQPALLMAALGIGTADALVLRHPVVAKRTPLPAGVAERSGASLDTDASLAALRGHEIYFGETMSFYIALASGAAAHNRLWLQLAPGARDNLCGLPAALQSVPVAGIAGTLGRLEPGQGHQVT